MCRLLRPRKPLARRMSRLGLADGAMARWSEPALFPILMLRVGTAGGRLATTAAPYRRQRFTAYLLLASIGVSRICAEM